MEPLILVNDNAVAPQLDWTSVTKVEAPIRVGYANGTVATDLDHERKNVVNPVHDAVGRKAADEVQDPSQENVRNNEVSGTVTTFVRTDKGTVIAENDWGNISLTRNVVHLEISVDVRNVNDATTYAKLG